MAHNPAAAPARAGFLEALRVAGNVTEACSLSGIDRTTAYRWRREEPEFAEAWAEALDVAWDSLEREAVRRARDGWDEPVYQGGELVGVKRMFSDRLLELLLKAKRAKEFREAAAGATVNVTNTTATVVNLPADPAAWLRDVMRGLGEIGVVPAAVLDSGANGHEKNGRAGK